MSEDSEQILSKFEKLFKEKDFTGLLDSYVALKQTDKDEAFLQSVLSMSTNWLEDNPLPEIFLLRGFILVDLEEFEQAVESYDEAIVLDPAYTRAYRNKGNTQLRLKNYQEAEESYKAALKLEPKDLDVLVGIGNYNYQLGNYQEAAKHYQKASKIYPEDLASKYNLALVDTQIDRPSEAIQRFNEIIEIDPEFGDIWNDRGNTFFSMGQFDDALKDYEKAIEMDPNHNHAHYNKGLALINLEENDAALKSLNRALEVDPNYASVYFYLGTIYRESKEYDKAIANLERYKELVEDNYSRNWADRELNEIWEESGDNDIRALQESIDIVKGELQFEGEHVTHYTNLGGAKILLTNKSSSFRMSEANYMNDTTEGERLKNEVLPNHNFAANNIIKHKEKPFLGSFVDQQKNNDLTLWRMYARTEGIDGKGCAITLKTNELLQVIRDTFFADDEPSKRLGVELESGDTSQSEVLTNKNPKKNKLNISKTEFNFFKVAYLNEKGKCIVNNKLDKKINTALVKIKEAIKAITDKNDKELMETALSRLSEIEYLFKGAEYQHESEVRLILSKTGKSDYIAIDQSDVYPIPRVYLNIGNLIPAVHSITIGPKVERPKEWASMFNYQFQEFGMNKVEVFISQLPYK